MLCSSHVCRGGVSGVYSHIKVLNKCLEGVQCDLVDLLGLFLFKSHVLNLRFCLLVSQ